MREGKGQYRVLRPRLTGQGSVCWLNRQGLGLWLSEGVDGFSVASDSAGASYLLSPICGVWSDLCSLTCPHWESLVQPGLACGQRPLERTAWWLDLAKAEGQKETPALSLREHCRGPGRWEVLGDDKNRSSRDGQEESGPALSLALLIPIGLLRRWVMWSLATS